MASTSQAIAARLPNMDFEKIRKTDEERSRVSVIDLIAVVSKVKNPPDTWKKLHTSHPEIIANSYDYKEDWKFPGRRNQKTPVINATGAIMIINLLPGAMAASFRAAWADIIVRYIGGDETLKVEIERNNALQEELHEDDPRAFFRQDVEARGLKSVTGVQNIRNAQVYFGSAGPPENWVDIRRQDGSPYIPKEGEHIIKFGCHDENTGRHGEHVREYKTWEVYDSPLTDNPPRVERGLKDHIRNKNALLSARHINKTTRDTELFAANFEIYEAYVNKAIELASIKQSSGLNMDYERELTKRMEEETKRMQTDSEVQKARIQADLEVQKLQIQLEMMRLRSSEAVQRGRPQDVASPQSSREEPAAVNTSTQTTLATDSVHPFEEYVTRSLESCSRELWIQWLALLADFRTWHDTRFPDRPLSVGRKSKDVRAVREYFIKRLGPIKVTQRKGKDVNGIFGWRFLR